MLYITYLDFKNMYYQKLYPPLGLHSGYISHLTRFPRNHAISFNIPSITLYFEVKRGRSELILD